MVAMVTLRMLLFEAKVHATLPLWACLPPSSHHLPRLLHHFSRGGEMHSIIMHFWRQTAPMAMESVCVPVTATQLTHDVTVARRPRAKGVHSTALWRQDRRTAYGIESGTRRQERLPCYVWVVLIGGLAWRQTSCGVSGRERDRSNGSRAR